MYMPTEKREPINVVDLLLLFAISFFYLPLERNMYLHLNKSECHLQYSTEFFLASKMAEIWF